MKAKQDDDEWNELAHTVFGLLELHKKSIIISMERLNTWRQLAIMTFITGQVGFLLSNRIAGFVNLAIFVFAMWQLYKTSKEILNYEPPIIPQKVA